MLPGPQALEMYRGDDFEFTFRVRTQVWNPTLNKFVPDVYVDLTGWTGFAQLRETAESPNILLTFDVSFLPQYDPAQIGGVVISAPAASTALLVPNFDSGNYYIWDCQLSNGNPGGKTNTYLRGPVSVMPDISRA